MPVNFPAPADDGSIEQSRLAMPITVITGFLGAGKTTLLHRILADEGSRRLGVLVNDFGELSVDAELVIPEDGANGVIAVQGGRFAGWALYVKEGVLKYCYNWLDAERYFVSAREPLPSGAVTVQFQFGFDGGTPGAGGNGRLIVDGETVGEGRIEKTVPFVFSADETLDIGKDTASPVTDDYPGPGENVFNGTINWVQIDLGDDDVSGLHDPEQVYHRILARQ